MFYLLLGLLVILPIAEIAVIVEVGQATNWLVVVLLTVTRHRRVRHARPRRTGVREIRLSVSPKRHVPTVAKG